MSCTIRETEQVMTLSVHGNEPVYAAMRNDEIVRFVTKTGDVFKSVVVHGCTGFVKDTSDLEPCGYHRKWSTAQKQRVLDGRIVPYDSKGGKIVFPVFEEGQLCWYASNGDSLSQEECEDLGLPLHRRKSVAECTGEESDFQSRLVCTESGMQVQDEYGHIVGVQTECFWSFGSVYDFSTRGVKALKKAIAEITTSELRTPLLDLKRHFETFENPLQ